MTFTTLFLDILPSIILMVGILILLTLEIYRINKY